jgi:hypothetical protein
VRSNTPRVAPLPLATTAPLLLLSAPIVRLAGSKGLEGARQRHPGQFETAANPGDFDWGDAAMGASVGFVLALVGGRRGGGARASPDRFAHD